MAAHLPEAWQPEDDWRQASSLAERRRLQNRLNQRVHRKRKHLRHCAANNKNNNLQPETVAAPAPSACPTESAVAILPQDQSLWLANIHNLPILLSLGRHPLYEYIASFLRQAYVDWCLNHPNLWALPGLARLNTMDALLRNAFVLQIPVEYLESDDYDSIFNSSGLLSQNRPHALPTDLSPTAMQKVVTHHSWLDLFPFPGMRDNILRGISTGELDENQLSVEICCDLLRLDATSPGALIIWGEAWEASSWEFSPDFFRKWGQLLRGCPQALEATNHWRQERGEMRLDFHLG